MVQKNIRQLKVKYQNNLLTAIKIIEARDDQVIPFLQFHSEIGKIKAVWEESRILGINKCTHGHISINRFVLNKLAV